MLVRSTGRNRSIAALLLVAPMSLALAACGGGSSGGDTASTTSPGGTTAGVAGDPAAGKVVFTQTANPPCSSCHTLADAGASGSVGPNLDDVKPSFDKVKAQVENGGGPMPAYKGQLTDQQINDVAAYVSSVAGQ